MALSRDSLPTRGAYTRGPDMVLAFGACGVPQVRHASTPNRLTDFPVRVSAYLELSLDSNSVWGVIDKVQFTVCILRFAGI